MLAGRGRRYLPKSRYDSISVYLADCVDCHDKYQDLDPPVATGALPMLLDAGVDKHLARHIAHLFVRDPLVIRPDRIHLNDTIETDHFENLQSTNWQTIETDHRAVGSRTAEAAARGVRAAHRVARRVSFHGSAAHRLRERGYKNGTRLGRGAPHMHAQPHRPPLPLLPLQRSPCSWCSSRA